MKESMTKFDLEAAFKALSEIDVPEAGGVKANKPALTEIFSRKSKFDTLMEEYYDISTTDGLEDAKEARDAAVAQAKLARIEKIVDLDAQSAEDLLTTYVGKYIVQCPQCLTLFYKNPEDVEASEEDPTTVNVSEVCQHCGNESGYTLVGKVGEAAPEEEVETEAEEGELEDLELEDTEEEATDEVEEDSEEADEEIDLSDLDFDDEDLDLDLEDEEDNKTEESLESAEGQLLVEDLETIITEDMEVSAEEFEKLINSPEFKKPISDTAVRAMLKTEAPAEAEEVEEDIKEEVPEDEVLEEGIFDKAKEKFAKVADAVASKLKSREDKANWILKNAVTDVNAAELVDKAGKLEPDDKDLRFKCFVVKCFKNVDKNGKAIRIAPTLKEITDLVPTEKQPGITDDFKKAEDFAKGYSGKDGNGPAFIFLAKDAKDTNAVFLCQYFEGEAKLDQLEKYFAIVKKDFASIKKMQASGLKLEDEEVEAAVAEATDTEEPKTESLDSVFSELEELQEDTLESLISTSLVEAYDNVAGFRLKECSFVDNKFLLNGVIHFVSGNTRSTTYTFTEALIKDQTVTLNGVNEKLGADKQFVLTGHINAGNKTFITEAFVANKK